TDGGIASVEVVEGIGERARFPETAVVPGQSRGRVEFAFAEIQLPLAGIGDPGSGFLAPERHVEIVVQALPAPEPLVEVHVDREELMKFKGIGRKALANRIAASVDRAPDGRAGRM